MCASRRIIFLILILSICGGCYRSRVIDECVMGEERACTCNYGTTRGTAVCLDEEKGLWSTCGCHSGGPTVEYWPGVGPDSESVQTDTAETTRATDSAQTDTGTVPASDPRIPSVQPNVVEIDDFGVIHMLVKATNTVYRYSIETGDWLPQTAMDDYGTVQSMAVSDAHERLYLGFSDGSIMFMELQSEASIQHLTTAKYSVDGLAAAGNFLLAQGTMPGRTPDFHWFYAMDGAQTDTNDFVCRSSDYTWNAYQSRIYAFKDNSSPNDLTFETIEQKTGKIINEGDTPYHGGIVIEPPIVISPDGANILLGSGDIYDARTLEIRFNIGDSVVDATWTRSDDIIVLGASEGGSQLLSVTMDSTVQSSEEIGGTPIAVVQHNDGNVYAVTLLDFQVTVTPSTIVEALAEADMDTNVPSLLPNKIEVDEQGIVYLLIMNAHMVYRYDTAQATWLPPLLLTSTESIEDMAVSNAHQRLYIGYGNGDIRYFETTGNSDEQFFYSLYGPVSFLLSAGDYLFAQDTISEDTISGALSIGECSLFSADGEQFSLQGCNYDSEVNEWNPVNHAVYHFNRIFRPYDIVYFPVNPETGKFEHSVSTPDFSEYDLVPPLVISPDGAQVLVGAGDLFDAESLEWITALTPEFIDAKWATDDVIHMLTYSGIDSEVFTISTDGTIIDTETIKGTPVGLVQTEDGGVFAITSMNGQITVTPSSI